MTEQKYTIKDFKSENEVRWCPGCGDYAIMNAVQRTMADMGIPKEKFAVISGIGCSSRFPYYMNTFGFHTIHGRAAAVASGVKMANPDLSVWVVTGDGDAMAIGGNHFIHTIRRNMDLNIVLFNNRIYGLTKGQYSPTSDRGFRSKTSPFGTIEDPFVPGQLVVGAKGTFFARTIDGNLKVSQSVFQQAAAHKGASVVEVLQNCVIYNNGVHKAITDPEHRADRQLILEQGKPMLFGAENEKGLIMENGRLKVVKIGKNGITENDILVHDATDSDPSVHLSLISMGLPDFPAAFGVIRNVDSPAYDTEMENQIKQVQQKRKITCVDDLLVSGNTWEVTGNGNGNGKTEECPDKKLK
ncbi:2-oxoglutarate ferredoxin oxidoreductase subunit beta [Tangfeifania diversioriginum]|uniref:2-oxoglutarate ferredoxin oxidoreductase subunit beta n=1 Tax=Tangfeifania diversioriginum TaxID=1168035 RepID=A0A1M6KSE1_9BACT|nr:2-oxoacid:ferredoxin oxidoreductase subunit beta [Tangfeifania diversioriginum]SHJ61895.1 2-oxoglutarate ferredoxin oxidoreductase subunit beta [Tangfeifania diversioriginum]